MVVGAVFGWVGFWCCCCCCWRQGKVLDFLNDLSNNTSRCWSRSSVGQVVGRAAHSRDSCWRMRRALAALCLCILHCATALKPAVPGCAGCSRRASLAAAAVVGGTQLLSGPRAANAAPKSTPAVVQDRQGALVTEPQWLEAHPNGTPDLVLGCAAGSRSLDDLSFGSPLPFGSANPEVFGSRPVAAVWMASLTFY